MAEADRRRRIEEICDGALDCPSAERDAFVAAQCDGDEGLWRDVQALLAHAAAADRFLEAPVAAVAAHVVGSSTAPELVGHRVGAYTVVGRLGAGGMGDVYRARDTHLGRDVAIKVLPAQFAVDAERVARFEREARVLAALNHPHIAAIYGIERAEGVTALVLELVDGETLTDRISRGPIPIADALTIARQIADALDATHEKAIVHRDLKPANIALTPDGIVKVLDFGLATASPTGTAVDLSQSPSITVGGAHDGVLRGTVAYMSPEQVRGQSVDRRADIWAYGCVVYEMLTGRMAFPGETVSDHVAAILGLDPDWSALPGHLPATVRHVLQRCLEKDPKRRWRDIADVRFELDAADRIAESDRGPRAQRTAIPAAMKVLFFAMAAVCIAAITAAIVLYVRAATADTHVITLSVVPPEGTTFDFVTISPDGHVLAFTATDGSGTLKLWVRPLDSLDSRALPGTEGAQFPFWSPDSRQLGFSAGEQLRKIAVSGGPPQTICKEADSSRGATWSRTGQIVFTYGSGSPLMQVSADGGVPTPLTSFDTSKHETSHRWPYVLPDGHHVVFTVRSSEHDVPGIYLGSIDSPSRTRLLADLSNAAYVTTPSGAGYLLFARGPSLLAQRLDLDARRLLGEPTVVAEHVWFNSQWSRAAFSVSETGVLVFDTVTRGRRDSELAWFDRTGTRHGSFGQFAPLKVSLSPDGAHLALDPLEETGTVKLWTVDLARGVPMRLTSAGTDTEWTPIWSPDGTRIAFGSEGGIFVRNASGIGERSQVLKSDRRLLLDDWSRDGRFLTYRIIDDKPIDSTQDTHPWLLPMSGADRKPISFGQTGLNLAFSPDSKWVALESNESGNHEIYVRPLLESGQAAAGKWRISKSGGRYPRWRGDGRELFHLTDDLTALIAVPVVSAARFDAGPPDVLFHGRLFITAFDVTPDGQRFFMAAPIPVDASAPVTIVLNWMAALKQ